MPAYVPLEGALRATVPAPLTVYRAKSALAVIGVIDHDARPGDAAAAAHAEPATFNHVCAGFHGQLGVARHGDLAVDAGIDRRRGTPTEDL